MTTKDKQVFKSGIELAEYVEGVRKNLKEAAKLLAGPFKTFVFTKVEYDNQKNTVYDLIRLIAVAEKDGNWGRLKNLITVLLGVKEFKDLDNKAVDKGFKAIGFVGGVKGGYYIKGDGQAGFLISSKLESRKRYSTESVGVGVGAVVGAEGYVGLVVSTDNPGDMSGIDTAVGVSGDFGVGVGAAGFWHPEWTWPQPWGLMILVSLGAEIDISIDASYRWVQKLP